MKKSYSFAIAAIFAALMSIPSCSYLEEPGKNENTGKETGTRTVNLCFPQTKTTLDGYQPVWSADDKIVLADGTGVEYYEVKAKDAGKAQLTITTSLTGTITAVYPSGAAVLEGDGIIGVKVSESQDGSFAKANICLAVEDDESSNLMFKNQTAVIKVRVPAGTTKLTVTSLGKIGENGQRGTAAKDTVSINDAGSAPDYNVTTVSGDNAFDGDSCFVSIKVIDGTPLYLTDLNFDVEYTDDSKETHKAQGGFSPLSIKAAGVADPYKYIVKKNDLHTLAASSLHEYVVVGEGEKARKWATMNVGASSKDDYGYYFAWGETKGHELNEEKTEFKDAYSFSWSSCPHTEGTYGSSTNVFTKYTAEKNEYAKSGSADGKKVLELADDAAFWNWGGAWRMPTVSELRGINTLSNKVWDDTRKGYCFTAENEKVIFFPAAGRGSGSILFSNTICGYYWSSSLNDSLVPQAHELTICSSYSNVTPDNRYYASSVRAISE